MNGPRVNRAKAWTEALGRHLGNAPEGVRFFAAVWPEANLLERAKAARELRAAAEALERENAARLSGVSPPGLIQ